MTRQELRLKLIEVVYTPGRNAEEAILRSKLIEEYVTESENEPESLASREEPKASLPKSKKKAVNSILD